MVTSHGTNRGSSPRKQGKTSNHRRRGQAGVPGLLKREQKEREQD